MVRIILRKKNYITLFNGLLIALAFLNKWIIGKEEISFWIMAAAGVFGVIPIAIQAFQALRVKVVSIDLLVTMAVLGAFIIKNVEEAAIVTFLFLFGAYLEQRTINKTRSAIKELTELAPESALKLKEDGSVVEVEVDEVLVGDLLLVKTGAKVPVDGKVVAGNGHVNEASITGEAIPVSKSKGEGVFAGTILENGTLQIVAERVGEDTTFGKIIELVEEAQDSKSKTERFIDRFAKYYTPVVLIFALLVGLIMTDVEIAITILVLGCPGALVIGVPVSNVAGIGNGARHGILLKGSEVIQVFSRVDTIAFDKTGTLTIGKPQVTNVLGYDENDKEVISYLVSVEKESDHPLAKAIVEYFNDIQIYPVEKTEVIKGGGIISEVNSHQVAIGNAKLMTQVGITSCVNGVCSPSNLEEYENSVVLVAVDRELKLLVGIRDQIRPGVQKTIKKLKILGVKNLIVLSGDNQKTVDKVAKEIGLTEAYGNMLPEDKSNYLKKLQQAGHKVAFVGDGINDSPSLAVADIGIAMGNGTDVAIETSDVVLMNSEVNRLTHALGLARATALNMLQNIFIAIGVVLVLLASVFFSEWMNMSIGMLVHEGSILVVILNGMRLLRYHFKS